MTGTLQRRSAAREAIYAARSRISSAVRGTPGIAGCGTIILPRNGFQRHPGPFRNGAEARDICRDDIRGHDTGDVTGRTHLGCKSLAAQSNVRNLTMGRGTS